MEKKNLERPILPFVIFFTSIIGFIIYITVRYGEVEISENGEKFSNFDDFIKEEEESEFKDEIEEVIEEEIEDDIENFLDDSK
ncbi:MAG: hypothetical protein ACFFB0_13015 [Promethearchaeota archaeon]